MHSTCILTLLISLFNLIHSFSLYPSTSPHPVKPRTPSSNKFAPTNAWFQNWLVGSGENPIHSYPYLVKASKSGFTMCYASQMVNANIYILEVFIANLALSVREQFAEPTIDSSTVNGDFFNLAAKVNFGTKFDVTVTRGSASIVANINAATPVLKTIHAITNVEKVSDRSIKVSFNNGQTWLIQSQSAISWTNSGDIFAQSAYTGWLKLSIVNGKASETALINAHDSLITNGKVSYTVKRGSIVEQVAIRINYNSQGLYYLLPHVKNPSGTLNINGATLKGIKGTYLLSQGQGYEYELPVYKSSNSQLAIDSAEKKLKLNEALKSDVNLKILSKDPYFGGKELARTARLIEIADLLGDNVSKEKAKNLLITELDSFWFGVANRSPALVYEPTWGGLVSKKSVGSPETDFGIYYYNDHHFHYGYFINAAATLAKHYRDYYNSRAEYFNLILADFAGTCAYKELPCKPRNKDPFLGHSFAAGLFEFADSRNQESTSESINSYFAVRELGIALRNRTLEDLGDFLLSTEIHATQTYWQIKSPSPIYPEPYSKNGVVGILWETKVDYATFFGANVEFIYGIQMLPFNEITQCYLDKDWLKETRPIWSVAMTRPGIEEGWKGFLLLSDSLVNPQRSGLAEQIHVLKDFDNGNSRTNTLYFYYLVGGSPSGSVQPGTTIGQGSTATSTKTTIKTTVCSGLNCNSPVVDNGKPDMICGIGYGLLGCHNLANVNVGCYNPSTATCFFGGNICTKPLLACLNLQAIVQGVACYDPSQYNCINGNLIGLVG